MPEFKRIVIDTSPLIALVAALGNLTFLSTLYEQVFVPFEVCQEIRKGGKHGFAVADFDSATFLNKQEKPLEISSFLKNALDSGESSVIQLALDKKIQTVCIDESPGRRIARLYGLSVTGSVGILIHAKKHGIIFSMKEAVDQMREKGIWLSDRVIRVALTQTDR